jgi:hypothetical protein
MRAARPPLGHTRKILNHHKGGNDFDVSFEKIALRASRCSAVYGVAGRYLGQVRHHSNVSAMSFRSTSATTAYSPHRFCIGVLEYLVLSFRVINFERPPA